MSLKTKLRVSIVTLVTLFVFAECVLSMQIAAAATFKDAVERAQAIAVQAQQIVLQRVNEGAAAVRPAQRDANAANALWRKLVRDDAALPGLLQKTLAGSLAVVEILVCDGDARVLASSNPDSVSSIYTPLPDFVAWTQRGVFWRFIEVMFQSRDYVREVPLGQPGDSRPVLTIRVVVSTVLLRDAIGPQVRTLAGVSALSLLVSIVAAYLFSNVILSSLDRLSQRIDSIATGQFHDAAAPRAGGEAKEFADMQSKLDALSQQFRGARDDVAQLRTNIDNMLERLEEAVLVFDTQHQLQRASRSAEVMLGMTREEMAARSIADLFSPGTALGKVLRDALVSGRPARDLAITLVRRDGSHVRVLANVELMRGSVLLTLRDAETRRQLRTQLDISTRLAAISRLTGGVAHEIKNPLNAMALHLEILRSKIERDEHPGRELEVIGGEIARLDRVVKTFLDFTRPVELNLKPVDLSSLAEQVAGLVKPEATLNRATIELEAPGPAWIRGDEDLLKQAVLNVVNNGIEAMRSGGTLFIGVAREGEDYVLRISDQGSGIPPGVRDKIFNLYFTTKTKGSGIGLAMTFRVVQLHNATIDFQSEDGRGTTFRLRFPASEPGEIPVSSAAAAAEERA